MTRANTVTVLTALLVLSAAVVAAAATVSFTDDGDDKWNQTSVKTGDITLTAQNDYTLAQQTGSERSFFADKQASASSRLDVTNDRVRDGQRYARFDTIRTDSGFTFKAGSNGHSGSAFVSGSHYFVDSANDGSFAYVRRWNENGTSTLVEDFGQKQIAGLATGWFLAGSSSDDELITGDRSSAGTTSDDFVVLNLDTGSTTIVDDADTEFVVRGLARYEADLHHVWVIDDSGADPRLKRVAIDNSTSVTVKANKSLPLALFDGTPRGLAYNKKTEQFYAYDDAGGLVIWWYDANGDPAGQRITATQAKYFLGSVDRGESYAKVALFKPEKNAVAELATEDLTYGTTATWTSGTFEYANEHVNVTNGNITFEVGQLWGTYDVTLQRRPKGGSWQTVASMTVDASSTTATKSFSWDSNPPGSNAGFQVRVLFSPGAMHGLARSDPFDGSTTQYPKVTELTFEYATHKPSGTVEAHDADDSQLGIDMGDVYAAKNLTVQGAPAGGDSAENLTIVNSEGYVICEVSRSVNTTVNLSDGATCGWDERKPANQRIFFRWALDSTGFTSAALDSWTLEYVERGSPPAITDWSATVAGRTTDKTTVYSGAGFEDEFTLESVNQSVENVTWYVNGVKVKSASVTGDGPFTLKQSWPETGTYTVTGEVFDPENGTDSVTWTVHVQDIAIIGTSAVTVDPSETFDVQETFEIAEADTAEIDVQLQYNDTVLEKTAGPNATSVQTGETVAWSFFVEDPTYSYGHPITITATAGNLTATKTIAVATTQQSGLIGVSGGSNSFVWAIGLAGMVGAVAVWRFGWSQTKEYLTSLGGYAWRGGGYVWQRLLAGYRWVTSKV